VAKLRQLFRELPLPPFFSGPSVPAILALADGTIFKGYSIGAVGHTTGEVVFNTAITGYQEILTDPSYSRQIVRRPPAVAAAPGRRAAGLVVYRAGQGQYRRARPP